MPVLLVTTRWPWTTLNGGVFLVIFAKSVNFRSSRSGISSLPKVTTQWCPARTRTRDLWFASPLPCSAISSARILTIYDISGKTEWMLICLANFSGRHTQRSVRSTTLWNYEKTSHTVRASLHSTVSVRCMVRCIFAVYFELIPKQFTALLLSSVRLFCRCPIPSRLSVLPMPRNFFNKRSILPSFNTSTFVRKFSVLNLYNFWIKILHSMLNTCYNLRRRQHDYQLITKTSTLNTNHFLIRMLYKDKYWHYLVPLFSYSEPSPPSIMRTCHYWTNEYCILYSTEHYVLHESVFCS